MDVWPDRVQVPSVREDARRNRVDPRLGRLGVGFRGVEDPLVGGHCSRTRLHARSANRTGGRTRRVAATLYPSRAPPDESPLRSDRADEERQEERPRRSTPTLSSGPASRPGPWGRRRGARTRTPPRRPDHAREQDEGAAHEAEEEGAESDGYQREDEEVDRDGWLPRLQAAARASKPRIAAASNRVGSTIAFASSSVEPILASCSDRASFKPRKPAAKPPRPDSLESRCKTRRSGMVGKRWQGPGGGSNPGQRAPLGRSAPARSGPVSTPASPKLSAAGCRGCHRTRGAGAARSRRRSRASAGRVRWDVELEPLGRQVRTPTFNLKSGLGRAASKGDAGLHLVVRLLDANPPHRRSWVRRTPPLPEPRHPAPSRAPSRPK